MPRDSCWFLKWPMTSICIHLLIHNTYLSPQVRHRNSRLSIKVKDMEVITEPFLELGFLTLEFGLSTTTTKHISIIYDKVKFNILKFWNLNNLLESYICDNDALGALHGKMNQSYNTVGNHKHGAMFGIIYQTFIKIGTCCQSWLTPDHWSWS